MDRRSFMTLILASLAGAASGATVGPTTHKATEPSAQRVKDRAERILDTRQIRCGYIPNGPSLRVDPSTKAVSGIFADITHRFGEMVAWNVTWTEESTWSTFPTDLGTDRFDIMVCGIWPNPNRAKVVEFSHPAFYSSVEAYVRPEDHRFDNDLGRLNDPTARIVTIDGELAQSIQASDFPHASVVNLPNTADLSLMAENVVTGKADAAFLERSVAKDYIAKNPGRLRAVPLKRPLRVFEDTWACALGASWLKPILDVAMKDMTSSGYMDRLLAQHHVRDSFLLPRLPFEPAASAGAA